MADDPRYDVRLIDAVEIIASSNPWDSTMAFDSFTLPANATYHYQIQIPITLNTAAKVQAIWVLVKGGAANMTLGIVPLQKPLSTPTYFKEWAAGRWTQMMIGSDVMTWRDVWYEPLDGYPVFAAGAYVLVLSIEYVPGTQPLVFGTGGRGFAYYYNGATGSSSVMTSPYFDISFGETAIKEDLGLVLTEPGALGFNVTWQSPFASQLGQGQVKEQDLTAYKVLTQNDWRGGRGQETAYQQPTNAYRDAVADTRFMNMAVLAPGTNRTVITAGMEQSYTPALTQNSRLTFYLYNTQGTTYAQQFTTGTGYTLTSVRLKLEKWGRVGNNWTINVWICANTGGLPGAKLATFYLADYTEFEATLNNPQYVRFTGNYALSASTTYWIVLVPVLLEGQLSMFWHDSAVDPVYGKSTAISYYTGTEPSSWGSLGIRGFAFILNNGSALVDQVTCNPVEFNGGWYVGAGTALYKWNTGTLNWVQQGTVLSAAITALAVLANKLYIAIGDSNDMVSSTDGSTWSTLTGRKYTYLQAYGGYLYAVKSTGGAAALGYYNGTTWADLTLGTSATVPTGLCGFQNEIIITTSAGLYSLSSNYVYQVLDYAAQRSADNGKGAGVWPGSGLLYVPIRNSLIAYNGQTTTQTGLDLHEGLPPTEQGRISAIAAMANWMFAAVDAGTGRSGIYVFNGAWHCLVKAASTGVRIRSIGIEAVTGTQPRLWWVEGYEPYYLELPQTTDNPYLFSGSKYQSTGYINGSRWLGELSGIDKDLQSVVIRSEGCSAAQSIDVQIELDRSGQWWTVGTVTQSPLQELELIAAAMATKTCAAGCTNSVIVVTNDSTLGDMKAGSFVRIGAEVRQVVSVDSATQFTLNRPLEDGTPAAGDMVVSSRPAGREVNYRVVLRTTDVTKTPKLLSVSIRYMEQLIDKARITLSIPVGDVQTWRNGAVSHLTGAQLYDALVTWGRRLTPFYLFGPDGLTWRVKCAGSMTWQNVTRTSGAVQARKVRGVLTMQLMEV